MANTNRNWKYKWKWTQDNDIIVVIDGNNLKYFKNKWIEIIPLPEENKTKIIISKGYSWNGCSVVPDPPGSRLASCVHDCLYQFSDDIIKAIGMDWSTYRSIADDIFRQLLIQGKCPVTGLYYYGVRFLGGIYHFFNNLF